jgi:hypothetical protein
MGLDRSRLNANVPTFPAMAPGAGKTRDRRGTDLGRRLRYLSPVRLPSTFEAPMKRLTGIRVGLPLVALLALAPSPLRADEGMWTLDNLPLQRLKERYHFTPSAAWIERVQMSAVSFGGGSGSFVSPEGLVLTNHHVALGQLQKISTAERDYVKSGFFAHSAAEELRCPDLELRVLQSMEDVTGRVVSAVDPHTTSKEQSRQRRAVTAAIEKESLAKTGFQSRVVDLYHGGVYELYRFKKYTDVRMVCAPEEQAAFFGGDPDNFCYPRHDLDFALFRVYEDGKPLHPKHWLRWSPTGPRDGDLVFVIGHPGSTGRSLTVGQLEFQRDQALPTRIHQEERRLAPLRAYSARGAEPARRAKDRIRGLENNLKRERAFVELLRSPLMDRKRRDEETLRARVEKKSSLEAECGASWARIAAAQDLASERWREYAYTDLARGSRLVAIAQNVIRYVVEIEKPNGERLSEYRDSNLESLRFQMYSPAPIYPDVDAVTLSAQLADARDTLGASYPWVKFALGGRTPDAISGDLLSRTRLGDVSFRQSLVAGGQTAVEASKDPLIVWARKLEPSYRELRKWHEEQIEAVEALEGGRIARARFALDGRSLYPDATGTLRLSYGKVAGYDELTTRVPWKTTFYGLYDRADSFGRQAPFDLPTTVVAARERVELATPLNFVSTDDIIGGNSGSPVINRDLELVGLIFDGNTQSFVWNYEYDDAQARAVSVHSSAILEALRKIYGMEALADELQPARPPRP